MAGTGTPNNPTHADASATPRQRAIEWDAPCIDQRIRDAGVRPTTARRWIVALLTTLRVHPTVEELQRALEAHDREIRQATLYQNLAKLTEAGVISSFLDPHGLMRFDGSVEAHPHLTCIRCGRVADIEPTAAEGKRLDTLMSGLTRACPDWSVTGVRLEFRALCPACAQDNESAC